MPNLLIDVEARFAALKDAFQQSTAEISKGVKGIQGQFDLLNGAIGKFKGLIATAAAGFSVGALVSAFRNVADEADAAYKNAQKFGVTVEALTGLEYAARLSDVSVETLGRGIKGLSQNLLEAKAGIGDGAKLFASLRLDPKQFEETDQLLLALADRFSRMTDPALKSGLAMKVFGKAGLELVPLLNLGKEGIEQLTAEAKRLGLVLSTDAAAAAEAFNDNLTRLNAVNQGIVRTFVGATLPILAEFTQKMFESSTATGSFKNELLQLSQNRQTVLGYLESLATGAAFVADAFAGAKDFIVQLGSSLAVVAKDIETALKITNAAANPFALLSQKNRDDVVNAIRERNEFVKAANEDLEKRLMRPQLREGVASFFEEERRTVRVMGQKFILETEEQAKKVQKIYDDFLSTPEGRKSRQPRNTFAPDLSQFDDNAKKQKEKLAGLLNELVGLSASFYTDLQSLEQAFNAQSLSPGTQRYEQYVALVDALIRKQPFAVELAKREKAAQDDLEKSITLVGEARDKANKSLEDFSSLQSAMLDDIARESQALDQNQAARAKVAAFREIERELRRTAALIEKEVGEIGGGDIAGAALLRAIELAEEAKKRVGAALDELDRKRQSWETGFKKGLRDYLDDIQDNSLAAEQAVKKAFGAMEDALVEFATTGKLSFKGFVDSILSDIARIIIRKQITGPIAEAVGEFASTMLQGHRGAVVGYTQSYHTPTSVQPIKRLHTGGLAGNEVPYILKKGEGVFTPEQMKALAPVGAGGSIINVNVIGATPKEVKTRDDNGNITLDLIFEQVDGRIAGGIMRGSGATAAAIERRYGLSRTPGSF